MPEDHLKVAEEKVMAVNSERILVVEDEQGLREMLCAAFEREAWEVMGVPDATTAEAAVDAFRPDVAILDIHLGDGPDGLTLARRIRERSDLPFLFLTDRAEVDDRLAGFESGADDYLAKPFILAELLARVRVVLRRRGRLKDDVIEFDALVIDGAGRRVTVAGEVAELTRIEFELLARLAGQAGRVVSKTDLLAQLWGFEGYDQNLVEVHISSLRRKLGASGKLIQTVRGVGYVLRAS